MTKEQEKVIEELENLSEYGLCYTITSDIQENIRVALNLIKTQQEKIEIQSDNYKNLSADVSNIAKELGLEDDATIDEIYVAIRMLKSKRVNMFEQLQCLEKKDKIIDEMAKYIEILTVDLKIPIGENVLWNIEGIKQYFER